MAEAPLKRQREETQIEDGEESKRHKSYNHILSLLDAEEEEPTQDISSLISTLQQELSSDDIFNPLSFPPAETDPENPATASATLESQASFSSTSSASPVVSKEDEEDDKDRVIRHLLEASDDELGIPNREAGVAYDGSDGFDGIDGFSLCDGLWELEDEAANYYTLLQSELFL